MAQADPAEHVPFAAPGKEMLDQRLDHCPVVLWTADHATNLGHRIDAEELHHAQHRRADAGEGGAHQWHNGHEAAAIAPHDMTEELVAEQRAAAADKVFPPRDDIGRRGERSARRGLAVEQVPFGGYAAKRFRTRQPLDSQPPAYRKMVVHSVSTRLDQRRRDRPRRPPGQ